MIIDEANGHQYTQNESGLRFECRNSPIKIISGKIKAPTLINQNGMFPGGRQQKPSPKYAEGLRNRLSGHDNNEVAADDMQQICIDYGAIFEDSVQDPRPAARKKASNSPQSLKKSKAKKVKFSKTQNCSQRNSRSLFATSHAKPSIASSSNN